MKGEEAGFSNENKAPKGDIVQNNCVTPTIDTYTQRQRQTWKNSKENLDAHRPGKSKCTSHTNKSDKRLTPNQVDTQRGESGILVICTNNFNKDDVDSEAHAI